MEQPVGPVQARPTGNWRRVFGIGLLLWVATVVVTLLTRNPVLVPTLVLLGSFLVPVSFVTWALQRWRDEHVTTELVVRAFVVGGLLGVLASALLENYLLHPSPWLFGGVGLIEEGVKLAALLLVTRHLTRRHTRDGIVLGATVGFGFAAFETAGYAFNATLTVHGLSLSALVQTELLRSVVAPLGHGLWTGILGGVLFHSAARGRWLTGRLLLAYLWVSLLHAFWDGSHDLAVLVTVLLTGSSQQYRLLRVGYLATPTTEQTVLFTVLSIAALVAVALVGMATLSAVWRSGASDADQPDGYPSARYGQAGPTWPPTA
ncbi:MAG TPA: PrsW family glutamic-type intramembrane protease [Rugosimonospora sp.]|jgi:RsiW-degrading membrane proteinase PrsW (M82 family)